MFFRQKGFSLTFILLWLAGCNLDSLPVATKIVDQRVHTVDFRLGLFAMGKDDNVYGAKGPGLFRIVDNGTRVEPVFTFADRINAIHFVDQQTVYIATDSDHWNPQTPSQLFRSTDSGVSFELVKTISGGSILWWSIASDSQGNVFVSEYGPRKPGMSKTLWRSKDGGDTWETIYRAPDREKLHLHRVAVDPQTNAIWLTVGDGKRNRGAYRSLDDGENWKHILDSQATAIAFTKDGIYFGEDHEKTGRVSYLRRDGDNSTEVFDASDHGNYGGSIYDMTTGRDGIVYVPTMKYPDQDHIISLWAGKGENWNLLLEHESHPGKGGGFSTIAGPDRDGWIYITGYKIKDH